MLFRTAINELLCKCGCTDIIGYTSLILEYIAQNGVRFVCFFVLSGSFIIQFKTLLSDI